MRTRSTHSLLLPVLAGFFLAAVVLAAPKKKDGEKKEPAPPDDPGLVYKSDFESLAPGKPPAEFLTLKGPFSVAESEGGRALRLEGEPIDGCVIQVGSSFKGGGTILARIRAESRRRVHPMFGLGLHGQSGFFLRIAPATRQMEIVRREEIVTSVPVEWKSGEWLWMEMTVSGSAGKWQVEGRSWARDGARPEAPQITALCEDETLSGRATLRGAQYSGHDLWFDDVEVRQEIPPSQTPPADTKVPAKTPG
ncbi:MAG: hypothetical protein AB7I98_01385 [Verrucomicrobiales bacterium]|nr:hypothetical protein [Verrucomicrobiae bacterium]